MKLAIARSRSAKGQMVGLLGLALAVLIIGVLGVLAFEFVRLTIARDQLRTATDAGALAAAAAIAGSNISDTSQAHTNGMNAAKAIFSANDVLGVKLTNLEDISVSNDPPPTPTLGQSIVSFQLFDNQGVAKSFGDPNAKVVQMSATYGYTPMFAAFLGLSGMVAPISVSSRGGVPTLDLVLCFDVSGSMDDSTRVTVVNRTWQPNPGDSTKGKIIYTAVRSGKLLDVMPSSLTGCSVNGFYPQRLEWANVSSEFNSPLNFNAAMRNTPNTNTPPGNFPPGSAAGGDFTDLVVNFSANADSDDPDVANPITMTFPFTSPDGKFYPSLGAVVEAARGNLEDSKCFSDSKASTALAATNSTDGSTNSPSIDVSQLGGYLADYEKWAKNNLHPMTDAVKASQNFFTIMKTNADTHFALVTFGGALGAPAVGTGPDFVVSEPKIAAGYSTGTSDDPVDCPEPLVPLSLTDPNFSGANSVGDKIATCRASRATTIEAAINEAISQLTGSNARPTSKKAIVLFTDGLPNPAMDSQAVAQTANSQGIKIYCVCLAQSSDVDTTRSENLLAAQKAAMQPLADGTQGQAFYTTSGQELTALFQQVARALTQLVSGGP